MLQLWVLILVVGGVHPFSSSLQDREKVIQLMNDDRKKQKIDQEYARGTE